MIGTVQPTLQPQAATGVWPLTPLGDLPSELFPSDYLYALIFEDAARIWKLDAKTLRGGLKYFLKKNDTSIYEGLWSW